MEGCALVVDTLAFCFLLIFAPLGSNGVLSWYDTNDIDASRH